MDLSYLCPTATLKCKGTWYHPGRAISFQLDNNSLQISPIGLLSLKCQGNGGLTWPHSEGPASNPPNPAMLVELWGLGYPSHTHGSIPGLVAIAQDVEAAAAVRGARAPGLGGSPEGQEPEHAQCHPHGSWWLCSPGRGLSLDCSVLPAQQAQQQPTGSSAPKCLPQINPVQLGIKEGSSSQSTQQLIAPWNHLVLRVGVGRSPSVK